MPYPDVIDGYTIYVNSDVPDILSEDIHKATTLVIGDTSCCLDRKGECDTDIDYSDVFNLVNVRDFSRLEAIVIGNHVASCFMMRLPKRCTRLDIQLDCKEGNLEIIVSESRVRVGKLYTVIGIFDKYAMVSLGKLGGYEYSKMKEVVGCKKVVLNDPSRFITFECC